MKIQVSKSLTLRDWSYGHSGFWYRDIDPPQPFFGTTVSRTPYERYVNVALMSTGDKFVWIPTFAKVSGLDHLDVPVFPLDKEEDAKAYVDDLIVRVAKISAFI